VETVTFIWKTAAANIWGNTSYSVENLAYGNNKFIATTDSGSGKIAYSTDNGANWTILDKEKYPFDYRPVNGIVFYNG